MHRASNYPDYQLPEMPRHCCPVKIFYFGFLVLYKDVTENYNCLPRPTNRESVVKCLSQGRNKMGHVGFINHKHGALTTRPRSNKVILKNFLLYQKYA